MTHENGSNFHVTILSRECTVRAGFTDNIVPRLTLSESQEDERKKCSIYDGSHFVLNK